MKSMDTSAISSFKLLFLFHLVFSCFISLGIIKLGFCKELYHGGCIEAEKEALISFKQSLKDPSGRLSSWIGDDCCKWIGIECNNMTGHVVKLNLRNPHSLFDDDYDLAAFNKSCLGGKIDPSLLGLRHLSYLDLSMNNFDGIPIPEFIGSLNTLTYLNLSYASFVGKVPTQLGNLSALHYLDLHEFSDSSGYFTLHVDNLHWLSNLTSLGYLGMGYVDLGNAKNDWLQVVDMLPSLLELHLSNCGLDNLPLTLPSLNFTSLSVLDLSDNNFNSSIPQWLFSDNLVKLDLSSNYFHGPIPDALANATSLSVIDLSGNNFNSSIPQWLFSDNLVKLHLRNNYFHGPIPDALANATSLQELSLYDNINVEGQIPRTLGNLCQLKSLDLSYTSVSGGIYDFVDNLSPCAKNSLEMLDLTSTEFTGYLPKSIGSLESLRILRLSSNSFWGSIPESISNLSSLEELDVSGNQMNIPKSIGKLSKLVKLDLSGNSWEGVLTDAHFCNLTGLKELYIFLGSSTKKSIVFNVTNEWMPPFRLESIWMSGFILGPRFPAWLQTQKELKKLRLINVGISDTIPNFIWELSSQLHRLDLSQNQIKGRVPKSLSFAHLADVYLYSNCLEGELPLWSNVSILYLSDNSFSGRIPLEIGNIMWPTLTALDLSNNSLNGIIPSSISRLKNLRMLALSNNHLFGEIPQFSKDLQNLWYVDLSHNNLSGSIPSSMGYLLQLEVLQLSNNDLYGELPTTLSNCSELRSLDLGKNRLSGDVSSWIENRLSHLSILRLRSNLFSGNIPSQLCHLSDLHILDLGDNNFSGFIPQCLGNLRAMIEIEDSPPNGSIVPMELVLKGREFEYSGILPFVKSIDLSRNSLSGKIPEELTNLFQLGTLNLSMNHLTGMIPRKIGSLKLLETLDFSRNQLTGPIPSSISLLTSLNHLNLSYNNLCGRIPTGYQLQTLNESSIYEGNSELCGPPVTMLCPNDETAHAPSLVHGENQDGDESEDLWFYSAMGLGFATGFWLVCGLLILKRSWRHAYFQFFDDMKEWILMVAAVKVNQLQRKMNLQRKPGF